MAKGRCEHYQGEGFVLVELLFLPDGYAPGPVCRGARYDPQTLEIKYRDRSIADVLALTVDDAYALFFAEELPLYRARAVLGEVGRGYLRWASPPPN